MRVFGFDDSLDVVGVHLVGGLAGTLIIGFIASAAAPAKVDGLFYGGGFDQLWRQTVAAIAVLTYSFVLTYAIGKVIDKTMGFRISTDNEVSGIDLAEHAETAYDFSTIGGGSRSHVISRGHGSGSVAAPAVDAGAESNHSAPAETSTAATSTADTTPAPAENTEGSVAR